MSNENLIHQAFNDPKQGFISASRLYRKLRQQTPGITFKEVNDVLAREVRKQQFQPLPRPAKFDTISAPYPRANYQCDLADMQNLKGFNDGVGYVCLVIDVYSRYALWLPCRSKTIASVKACLEGAFQTMGTPDNLTTDLESAILSNEVQQWLTTKGVKHWGAHAENKRNAALVERNIRTMRELMTKAFASWGTRRWLGPMILSLNENYNNSVNRMTKATPLELWRGEISSQVPVIQDSDFAVGDRVRVAKQVGFKDPLGKTSTMKTYSKAIYRVVRKDLRRFVCKNEKSGAETARMAYEMIKVPDKSLEFTAPKDSIYTTRVQTGKEAKAAKMQRLIDLELLREGMRQENVLERPKRQSTINDSRATQSIQRQRQNI
jgi:hypothetical protein